MKYLGLAVLLVLAGCALNNPSTPRTTYAPIPDRTLYARIAKVPGVTKVDIGWVNRFGEANTYVGDVEVRAGIDQVRVLDRSLAILRQGRPGAFLAIQVFRPGSTAISPQDFGLWSIADYESRYGPQPGAGVPPPRPLRGSVTHSTDPKS